MVRKILGTLWRKAPRRVRRLGVRLSQPSFTVTAGAVVLDEGDQVLLLKHVFRTGSGWGIPGGFLRKGEQPEEAIMRELWEEVGLEVKDLELVLVRTLKNTGQVEIVFRGRSGGEVRHRSTEIHSAEWFPLSALPEGLSSDQRAIIGNATEKSARTA